MVGAGEPGDPDTPPEVTVRVPGLLSRFTDGQRSIVVRSRTVGASIDALLEAYPALEPHLRDGGGRLRPHLTLFHDGAEVSRSEADEIALERGSEVVVLQAVSGGSDRADVSLNTADALSSLDGRHVAPRAGG